MKRTRKKPILVPEGSGGNPSGPDGLANTGDAEGARLFELEITWGALRDPEVERLRRSVRNRMEEIHELLSADPAIVFEEVRELAGQYPRVMCFRNWLCVCLRFLGREEEARDYCEATVRDHPDYLFGRMSLAEMMLDEGNIEGAVEVLGGEGATLASLYPRTRRFHITEVRHWFFLQAEVLILKNKIEDARAYRHFLHELEPWSPAVMELDRLLNPGSRRITRLPGWMKKIGEAAGKMVRKPAKSQPPVLKFQDPS